MASFVVELGGSLNSGGESVELGISTAVGIVDRGLRGSYMSGSLFEPGSVEERAPPPLCGSASAFAIDTTGQAQTGLPDRLSITFPHI